ncbi:MAG: beta-galactosidase [Candidatus Hydrogenedentes bacterium]|nr:beta-galactosidase [Candidatus Hydrogenedentota bacterium]
MTRPALFLSAILFTIATAYSQDIPRPEHPMPQAVRAEWLNLNGTWEFGETNEDETARFLSGQAYPERITVPFCRESSLSGIHRRNFVKNVWYRRTFEVPRDWTSPRLRLHIGACDWKTRVWVNGQFVGEHTGGNVAFALDITDAVKRDASNTVVVHAFDDTASGLQALGKQSNRDGESYAIFYTPTTGIWQTVWLEGVGEIFIKEFRIEPQPGCGRVCLNIGLDSPHALGTQFAVRAEVLQEDKVLVGEEIPAQWRDNRLVLDLRAGPGHPHLWTRTDPFLYDLRLSIVHKGKVPEPYQLLDTVNSYFGMREVTLDGAAYLINGEAIFQRLILDQGFYPDGIWTAPSDDALKQDIEMCQACGFNGARLHQKVFEPRFLYWADKLGYLVWGEFPSFNANYGNPAVDLPILNEWVEIVTRDRNHPSIIGWCPFNETPEEAGHLQRVTVNVTRQLDPSRPVLETSGWTHTLLDPEVADAHDYDQNPETYRQRWTQGMRWEKGIALPERYGVSAMGGIPFFVSEYGGIGWALDPKAWGYGNTPKTLDEWYTRFEGLTNVLLDSRFLFGLCYTQLTNVEQEQNGLYTFDRQPKFDPARLKTILTRQAAYEKDPPTSAHAAPNVNWQVLVGAIQDGPLAQPWRYTTEKPAGNWTQPDFDAASWKEGLAPFGNKGGEWKDKLRTEWTSDNIWLRQEFECADPSFDYAAIVLHFDDETEIYVNGQELWKHDRWNNRYESFEVTDTLKAVLKPGKNTTTVHTHLIKGGQYIDQYIDVALLIGKR